MIHCSRLHWLSLIPLDQLLDHLDYYVGLIGARHTTFGLDFVEGYVEATQAGTMQHKPPKWRTLRPDIFGTVEDFFADSYPVGLHSIRLLPNFTHRVTSSLCPSE